MCSRTYNHFSNKLINPAHIIKHSELWPFVKVPLLNVKMLLGHQEEIVNKLWSTSTYFFKIHRVTICKRANWCELKSISIMTSTLTSCWYVFRACSGAFVEQLSAKLSHFFNFGACVNEIGFPETRKSYPEPTRKLEAKHVFYVSDCPSFLRTVYSGMI